LTHIFGLDQAAYIAARKVLINKKSLGLKLLKKASQVNLKSSPDLLKDYWLFKVVPVSLQSKRARCLLKVLQGVIVELNDDSISAIDYINANHQPYYEDLSHVTNGGDNIMFGPPGRGLEEWGSFDKKPQLKPFINQVKPAILKCVDMPHIKDFQYSTSFLFSLLSSIRDNIPQLAHMDLKSEITEAEYALIQTKSMIGFTPINEDGMMILVWTEGTPKKYRDQDQIEEDNKR